jgi:DNA-directed RNA polymerase specialized sigma24 family protein
VSAREDEADVEKVLAGDLSAFEGIVRRWQGPLVSLAYRFCRDRGRAEELAQEAFPAGLSRASQVAQGRRLFELALRTGRKPVPLRAPADPGNHRLAG